MGALENRVGIITGAGHGLGRAHALLLAAEGAKVVVNDVAQDAAEAVVAEIREAGGEAVANSDDVSTWSGGEAVVQMALDAYGELHVLVNNAGILRDRTLVNMTEQDWDDVMSVHLKGHFVPTRFAARHWRERTKAGQSTQAAVVNTSSTSGLLGNPGQANYGAAKAGIAAFTTIAAKELARYGVRVNCIAPAARTRLTESTPGLRDVVQPPTGGGFDAWDPSNVSPLVAWLASPECRVTGRCYYVMGGTIRPFEPWSMGTRLERDGPWTIEEIDEALHGLERGM